MREAAGRVGKLGSAEEDAFDKTKYANLSSVFRQLVDAANEDAILNQAQLGFVKRGAESIARRVTLKPKDLAVEDYLNILGAFINTCH